MSISVKRFLELTPHSLEIVFPSPSNPKPHHLFSLFSEVDPTSSPSICRRESGQITYEWFDRMYPDVSGAGISFYSYWRSDSRSGKCRKRPCLGLTPAVQVIYLIVENSLANSSDFIYW